MPDQFGFKFVTRDYRCPLTRSPTTLWTVGSRHVATGDKGHHYCTTLKDLGGWLPVADNAAVRLLRVRIPAGSDVESSTFSSVASELVVVEELSPWHLTGWIPSWFGDPKFLVAGKSIGYELVGALTLVVPVVLLGLIWFNASATGAPSVQ
jgi:hypothetical protein